MILLTFHAGSELRLGVKTEAGVLDVAPARAALGAGAAVPGSMDELLWGGEAAAAALRDFVQASRSKAGPWFLPEAGLTFGPCVTNSGKIICAGLNYRRHAQELDMKIPESPVLFGKFVNALAAHGETIPLTPDGEQFDYEAELAIVVGRRAQNVSRQEALSYVAGYCNANDFSCRDLQFRTNQWLLGKSYDGWCPVGPYLVTRDGVPNPDNLAIRCYVNGELRQNSSTADLIFSCAELVSYASRYMTLEPGDLILTGTPEGVAMGMPDKPWLRPGDRVVVEVEGLGALHSVVGERR